MKKIIISLIFISLISHSIILYAEDAEGEYIVFDKFSRGVFNIITSPFEVPIAMHKISVEENPVAGLLYGLPLGIGKGFIRLAVGMVEVATTAIPPYGPILEPEYLILKK